jgi:murein DD-endopeptidase MepM/ murein hydrolase activator NlpD
MKVLSRQVMFALTIGLAIVFAVGSQFTAVSPTAAQKGIAPEDVRSTPIERPFQLPFAQPSGPDTWLMAQPYGNTTGAYRQRFTTYGASGGIHFGLDLSAPCGTDVVAVADGVVFAVDGPFGSPPHNLMIDHPDLGYASMYGHLIEAPNLVPGQQVKQGEVIARTGDSRETCYNRPHLHLEIRDLNHIRKYNPVSLIEANWENLAMTGDSGRDFARDLDEPRKWQSLYDQPEARTAGPIINDFDNPWPLDWEKGIADPATRMNSMQSSPSQPGATVTSPLWSTAAGRQITAGDCCTQPYWDQDSGEVRFIDQPTPDAPLGIWGVDPTQPESGPKQVTERLGVYSPDGALVAYPDRETGLAVIERLADGQRWELDTQGRGLRFTPDSQHVTWTAYDEDAPRETREETMWLANPDGSHVRVLLQARRTDMVAWLSADELLMTRRIPGGSDEQLFTLSLADGTQTELKQAAPRMRGLALSPDRSHLVYYVSFEPNAEENGVWLMDLQDLEQPPQKLPFFGTYRWRDNERLIFVPFDPDASEHNFYEYNLLTGETRSLFPAGTGLMIANNDWQVSPDGTKIAMLAANGTELDGIWVLDIDQHTDQTSIDWRKQR